MPSAMLETYFWCMRSSFLFEGSNVCALLLYVYRALCRYFSHNAGLKGREGPRMSPKQPSLPVLWAARRESPVWPVWQPVQAAAASASWACTSF